MEDIIIKTTLKIEIYKNKNNYEVEKEHNNLFIKNINFKNVDFFIENKLHMFTYSVIPRCLPDRILDCCNIVTLFVCILF